jgi:hypothetical protein
MRQNFRTPFILPMLASLLSLSASAQTPQRGPSTSTERARAVEVAKALRTDPISPQTLNDREWLMLWLIEIPDLTVKYCTEFLGDLSQEKKEYSGVLAASLMANEASFMIEHADKRKDSTAIYFAGVDGALDSYQTIQKKDSSYHLARMDELIQKREQGTLADWVKTTAKGCKNKK